ncbi:MAG TPA: IS200/IS605 family transposase [Thermoanaerobaculia bacterium]|nr:IS200/IS605 family transposase [Thermoanaerobaculia bacterium]
MPSTHTSLLYHLVFSTKNREPWFDSEWRQRVHAYLGGCIRTAGGVAKEVGGTADHVHLLVSLGPTHRICDVLRDIKQESSEWLHKEMRRTAFAWQEGYGAFSVSASGSSRVQTYIRNQESHHRRSSFQQEYRTLLERHGVAFDERYLW